MKSLGKCLPTGLLAVLLLLIAVVPSQGRIISQPDTSQIVQDLFLLGFGEVTMHALHVSGNKDQFEASNPSLKVDYANNLRLSMFANGNIWRNFKVNGAAIFDSRIADEYYTVDPSEFRLKMSVESTEPLWDGWRFTGDGLYDPSRQWEFENLDKRLLTQPQEPSRFELLMRLESEDNGVIEAGSLRPSFKGSEFSLHQRSLFGMYADLHTEKVGVEAVGGKLEGKAFREGSVEGVRADGTSGPYDLTKSPITRGSEEVKVEIRDRYDETTVLETKTLIRDRDYTVDYLLGRVLLHLPVASESLTGAPQYIVITYDYLRDQDDDIMGARARVMPAEGAQVSGTYLHRNIDDGATGEGVEEPENLFGADASFKLDDHTTGYLEFAGTDNPNDDDSYSAVRFGAKTEVIENLTLDADFKRIDDQFRSFTNSDLDAHKNQQRLHLGGDYKLSERSSVSAKYANLRGLEANGDFNAYDGLRNENILSAGYKNDLSDVLGLGFRFERRTVKDRDDANHEDNSQNRAILDLGGKFEDVGPLGKLGYKANYELAMFRNELAIGDHDANTNQLAVSFTSQPSERTDIELTQRFRARRDKELDLYDSREDATFLTLRMRPDDILHTLATYEYRRYTAPGKRMKLWQDDPEKAAWAGTVALEYLPLELIKVIGKVGRQRSSDWSVDTSIVTTTDFVLGQITYFHSHHLSFNAESEFRRTTEDIIEPREDKSWDLGLKVNWNRDRLNELTAGVIRRMQVIDNDTAAIAEETKSTSYILLLSGSMSLSQNIFARGSIKSQLLNAESDPSVDPLDDQKTFTKLEVGYDSNSWFRVSLGYERIEGDSDTPDYDYTGQGAFVRFTGKM